MTTRLRETHTFALLEVSSFTYDEIQGKLKEAAYDHAFIDDKIEMSGIALVRKTDPSDLFATVFVHKPTLVACDPTERGERIDRIFAAAKERMLEELDK